MHHLSNFYPLRVQFKLTTSNHPKRDIDTELFVQFQQNNPTRGMFFIPNTILEYSNAVCRNQARAYKIPYIKSDNGEDIEAVRQRFSKRKKDRFRLFAGSGLKSGRLCAKVI